MDVPAPAPPERLNRAGIGLASLLLGLLLASAGPVSAGEVVLKHDDGKAEDKRSTAGAGHAVSRFEALVAERHARQGPEGIVATTVARAVDANRRDGERLPRALEP